MKKLVLLGAAALTWAVIMIALIQYAAFAPVPPKADYHKMRIEPHLIEVVVTQTVEVKAEPYYSDIASNITAEEIDLLAKITYLEAGNQSMAGKRAVVEVILNRVLSDKFPDTIEQVIYQDNQFTPAARVATTAKGEYSAVEQVLQCQYPILEGEKLFFSTYPQKNDYIQIGDHYFC